MRLFAGVVAGPALALALAVSSKAHDIEPELFDRAFVDNDAGALVALRAEVLGQKVDEDGWNGITHLLMGFDSYLRGLPNEEKSLAQSQFISFMSEAYPRLIPQGKGVLWEGALVVQDDGLINLQRVPGAPEVAFVVESTGRGAAVANGARPIFKDKAFGTTDALMAQGKAPVGPEGLEVLLCRLSPSDGSPMFEMSNSAVLKFFSALRSPSLASSRLCRPGFKSGDYWKARRQGVRAAPGN